MDTMIGMMWSLLEDGKDEWHKFGYQMALPMGQAMVQDLRLPLDFNNPASVDNIEKLLLYAFNMGKYTGQVAVDVLMTICGVEFITGVLKVLKLGSSFFDELWPIIRRLIARVDSALPDELKGTAARVAAIIQARLEQFADEAVKLIDCTREEILNGFDLFKEWLKEPDYSDYVGCLFCNLAGKP
jgi:hypothetical protein